MRGKLNKEIIGLFSIFIISFFLFLSFQTAGETFLCPDSFYHAKMASFLAQGKLIKDFPWLPYTIFKENYSDHHFLYHLLLIPFVLVLKPFWGVKIATLFFATLTIIVFYWFLKKFKIKGAFVWTFLLLTSPVFLTRLNLAKVPSVILIVLLFGLYSLFEKKYLLLSIISFVYVWFYNSWPILLVAIIIYCFSSAIKKIIGEEKKSLNLFLKHLFSKENIILFFVCFFSLAAGLIINPYFPKNLYFNWVHIFKIGLKNYQNLLPVGAEWYPYEPIQLILSNLFIFIPWLTALGWFLVSFKKNKSPIFEQKVENFFLFIFSSLFFIYTIKSRRNVDYSVPLAILFTSFTFNNLFSYLPWRDYFSQLKKIKIFPYNLMTSFLIVSFLTIFLFAGISFLKDVWLAKINEFAGGANFNKFKKAAEFLKENTQTGEIIFHSSWDEFPPLFYHNDKNFYIAGLDPTFLYERNKSLYWLWFNIITGKQKKDLAKTIKNNFKARYVFIQKKYEEMKNNFGKDENLKKVYEDEGVWIYKIKD